MALQLERQLKASQNFLAGVRTLPNYPEILIKQHGELSRVLAKVDTLSTEVAGRVLSSLDMELWGEYADSVKQDIAARAGKDEANNRRSNQDYMALVHYLPAWLVARLESDRNRAQVLELLCCHLVKLGLRHPTEKTCGLILALAFDFHGVAFEADKWQYTVMHKVTVQKLLSKPEPSVYLDVLPADVNQCPRALFASACPDGQQPQALQFAAELVIRGRTWPIRTSHRVASQTSKPAGSNTVDYFAVGQMAAGFMSGGAHMGHRMPSPVPSVAPPLGKPNKLLALEDGQVDDVATSVPVPEMSQQPVPCTVKTVADEGPANVTSTLAALKGVVNSQAGIGQRALKKPASALQTKVKEDKLEKDRKNSNKTMKKPAASVVEKPRKVAASSKAAAKRPAASSKVGKKSTKKSDQREKKASDRLRLLATLPPKVRRQFKDGCSRCRCRMECTLSCWRQRGFFL